ncbi:MAG: DUF86 domain-containing protein [Clostridia bacterium]|nr:DUF86 domain-containing protein [Clostridia bacterium]MBO5258267.1 DUF86 domain-containing protein [Clostridia bacterium]MBP3292832.1 DUF86 domain-containing protein [Clostridia bacterium]MBQ7312435.1 DUF86 domain-containing protein [Clostridia bacterium]
MTDIERIGKIQVSVEKILNYSKGYDYPSFSGNSMLVEACVFNLSQIGELCHGVSEEYTAVHPEIPWHEMYGLRNRIVHNYEGVNLKLVWEIIEHDLPELKGLLENLLIEKI